MDKLETARYLHNTGLLFEINRRILHPLGLAIAVTYDDQEGALSEEEAIMGIFPYLINNSDDPEGMIFDKEALEHGSTKFRKFWNEVAKDKILERSKLLGYTIQSTKDIDTEYKEGHTPLADEVDLKDNLQEKTDDIDEEIEGLKQKNASKRITPSITDKISTRKKRAAFPTNANPADVVNPTDVNESQEFKKISKYVGKEHKKPGKPGMCISTKDNTTSAPIPGGPALVLCTECGATLKDPDLEER